MGTPPPAQLLSDAHELRNSREALIQLMLATFTAVSAAFAETLDGPPVQATKTVVVAVYVSAPTRATVVLPGTGVPGRGTMFAPPVAHVAPADSDAVVTLTPSLPSAPFLPSVPDAPGSPLTPCGPCRPGWPAWFHEISVSLSVQWDMTFVEGSDLSISRIVPRPLSMQAL